MEQFVKKFIEATAIWNCGGADISSALISEDDIVKTFETRASFITDRGTTKVENLFLAQGVQRKKGEPRGDLWVYECGDFRLTAFI